jgi:DNA-directed RNA polymerase sigma subunit (sigma70/sigma32)
MISRDAKEEFVAYLASMHPEAIRVALEYLSYREKSIIAWRLGLGEHVRSIEEIADALQWSRQRTEDVENHALDQVLRLFGDLKGVYAPESSPPAS